MLEKLEFNLGFANVQRAIVVGILIALCAALLGVTLVLKRYSMIGDGLSHVAFGAMAIAMTLRVTNNMLIIMPITILAAILLLRTGMNTKIKGDAAIAMLSVGALSLGYLIINIAAKSPNTKVSSNVSADVCSSLFGSSSILMLKDSDVIISVVMSIIVILTYIFLYNRIFAITFDETFAFATGTKAGLYNLVIAVITAVVIVLAMNLVGALLISALIVFPSLSAMRVFKSFRSVIICAAIVSVACAVIGLLVSIIADTPVGSTIVAADIAAFGIFWIIGLAKRTNS